MTRIRVALSTFIALLSIVWLTSDSLLPMGTDTRAQAVAFTQFTGLLALGLMAFANILTARPRWLEPSLGGLDKMYRLHKWLGIGGLALAILHWQTHTGVRPRNQATDAAASAAQGWLQYLHDPAMAAITPSLLVMTLLVVVALVRLIPYRIFAKSHILTVPLFAYFAFHSVVMMKVGYWAQPVGWLILLLAVAGTIAGVVGLFNYFGLRRAARGNVVASHYYPELRVLEADIQLDAGWPGHKPGQFAFVTTDVLEGAHPFTIATNWNASDRKIGFIAKELGDHTAKLRDHFAVGKTAKVQGPYGRFTFDDGKPRQIWVGGGIGITPFIAKMREMKNVKSSTIIDLFHPTKDESKEALNKLRVDAAAAGINLHILVDARDGLLDFDRIAAVVPEWKDASVWVCGPVALCKKLRRSFTANGLSQTNFHHELFEMR